jgi:hypothetical protein
MKISRTAWGVVIIVGFNSAKPENIIGVKVGYG